MFELLLEISLANKELCVVDKYDQETIECFEIAIGKKETPTPVGNFNITRIIEMPQYINKNGVNVGTGVLGDMAILTDNKTTEGLILAIHGTNQPQLIGEAVSGGCIRMDNYDINKLNLLYLDRISEGRIY